MKIIKKHPFHSANKRTAFMALDIFFKLKGFTLTLRKEQILTLVVDIATYTYQEDFDKLKSNNTVFLQDHLKSNH